MARPNKYDTHVAPRLNEIADWVRNGATEKEIAERLGISERTFYKCKKEFSQFSQVLKNTREEIDGQVENALLQAALNGNTTAQHLSHSYKLCYTICLTKIIIISTIHLNFNAQ